MKKLPATFALHALALHALATTAGAQSFLTSPPGMLSTEGTARCAHFGSLPEHRMQLVDGELRGSKMSVKSVGFRLNTENRLPDYGRIWRLVTLDISNGQVAATGGNFSLNPTSRPTRVFSANMSWPRRNFYYGVRPEPAWIVFPFKSAWTYTGVEDICHDFTFEGGSLVNKATWPRYRILKYDLDSYANGTRAYGAWTFYGNTAPTAECVDPTAPKSEIPLPLLFAFTHSHHYSNVGLRGKVQIQLGATNTRTNASIMCALGVGGSHLGIPAPGVACNRLHVDVSKPTVYVGLWAGSSGHTWKAYPFGNVPFSKSLAGFPLWTQLAFVHSKTNRLTLSAGQRALIPDMPRMHKRIAVSADRRYSSGGRTDSTVWNPIIRYER